MISDHIGHLKYPLRGRSKIEDLGSKIEVIASQLFFAFRYENKTVNQHFLF